MALQEEAQGGGSKESGRVTASSRVPALESAVDGGPGFANSQCQGGMKP